MKKLIVILSLSAAMPVLAQTFVFDLRGSHEVPVTTSTATGGCMGTLSGSDFSITCVHDVINATMMHIHRGAAGTTGPVVFDLGSPAANPVTAAWTGMSPADIADLLAGNLYVNIHSSGRPTGDIRGQILSRTIDNVAFTANEQQFVPPGSGSATASCTADLDNSATSLAIQCTHNVPTPQSAEMHEGAFGTNGPIVHTFASPNSPISESVPMTPQLVADFEATFLYLEIHGPNADENTAGPQVRGQIGLPPQPPSTGTIRIVKNTSPAGGTNFAFTDDIPATSGSFTLNDGGVQTFSNVPPGTYAITESNPSGYTLTDLTCSAGGTANPFTRTATVQLQAAETVTCTFTNLRSVAPTSIFAFRLGGDLEVPQTNESARGGCFAQFDSATSTLSMVCTHDVVEPTVMHIHHGAAGTTGTVAFDLGNPESPVEATWSNMSAGNVADLFAGNLYVNIHTAGRPGGAIRGQIVPRAVDVTSFYLNGANEVPPTDSSASGTCNTNLSDDAASLFVQCNHTVAVPTASHLHDAPPGFDGPVVFDFPGSNPFSGNVPLTPRLVADYEAGFLYVNVHSAAYDTGEIRGQAFATLAPATNAPTLSAWMLAALAAMLIGFAAMRLR
ncbi:MAG TPA: CHRD domain-containing protein [Thermoanaerobaculia bacterium]|nr:CHRD domain-containing protein [Thermoanaerobaculia bacterium]